MQQSTESPLVTIVVSQRESFRATRMSLRSIDAITPAPFSLIYVDGGSPPSIRRYLEQEAVKMGFTLIRTEHFLVPNQARNLALPHVRTKYVVFLDNDVIVAPGWLDALVQCAEETGAWVVGPVDCIGQDLHETVHMAGGEARIESTNGKRFLHEKHACVDMPLGEALTQLRRQPSDMAEFHCMIVRTDVFDRLGLLDEGLLAVAEHLDLCLQVREAGGVVYLEPGAVVTYLSPVPLAWSDLPFYILRWSKGWQRKSVDHFYQKWRLSWDDPWRTSEFGFLEGHRKLYYRKLHLRIPRGVTRRLFGDQGVEQFDAIVDTLINQVAEFAFVQPAERKRTRAVPPRR